MTVLMRKEFILHFKSDSEKSENKILYVRLIIKANQIREEQNGSRLETV